MTPYHYRHCQRLNLWHFRLPLLLRHHRRQHNFRQTLKPFRHYFLGMEKCLGYCLRHQKRLVMCYCNLIRHHLIRQQDRLP
jgi:hypothetical protein